MGHLEALGFAYKEWAEMNGYYYYLFVILGGVIGAYPKVGSKLIRSQYFLCLSAAGLLCALPQFIWLKNFELVIYGVSFVPMIIDVLTYCALGFAFVMLGKARSNDAFGKGIYGVMAVVPIANLVLIFKPSLQIDGETRSDWGTAFALVLLGLFFMGATKGLSNFQSHLIEKKYSEMWESEQSTAFYRKYMEYLLYKGGIEELLAHLAPEFEVSNVDKSVTVKNIIAEGKRFIIEFDVKKDQVDYDSLKRSGLPIEYKDYILAEMCRDYDFIIQNGAQIFHRYYLDGKVFSALEVDLSKCV